MFNEEIVQYLIEASQGDAEFDGVRFGTKKLDPTFKPYPECQVVVTDGDTGAGFSSWQGRTTLSLKGLLLIHTYCKDQLLGEKIAWKVAILLNGVSTSNIYSVSINEYPKPIPYEGLETVYYSNLDVEGKLPL